MEGDLQTSSAGGTINAEAGFPFDPFKNELKRKVFHFFSLIYAAGYFLLERGSILRVLTIILALESSIEFGRFLFPRLNEKMVALFGGIHRQEELHRPTGIFWTLLGSLLTMALFHDREAVLCSMGYLIFSDAAAALVGVRFGRHRFLMNKSVEGSIAFFSVSLAVGLFFLDFPVALAGAVFATLVELTPFPWNDNLWIPLVSASFLSVISR